MNEPETIHTILEQAKTIAVVGLSNTPGRPSFQVSRYMQQHGYRIVPVNPAIPESLGEKSYKDLESALAGVGKIDVVNVFRASEFVPEIVEEAIRLHLPALWLQEGVCDEAAALRAESNGIRVVMDRCIYREHAGLQPHSRAGSSCPV